jgi:hypothetical protein
VLPGGSSAAQKADDFRSLLDGLRAALARPVWLSPVAAPLFGIDRDSLLTSLESLIAALDAVDLDARRVLPPPSGASANPNETARLRSTLSVPS